MSTLHTRSHPLNLKERLCANGLEPLWSTCIPPELRIAT